MLVVLIESAPAFPARHEIDQASVKADGGFPYKITKSDSYKLTSNLVVPAGVDGIDVFAPDVTLDLNGSALSGRSSAQVMIQLSAPLSPLVSG